MFKSLELTGFKSFADKTRFDFPDGVTIVVGPNGSGKSNVVDALKWVLGSQSAKSLRGKEMTDVIFNGSASRGPLNSAEVTIAFDNPEPEGEGRRLFDLDEPEVRFTRRVYRSGEGEYLINGQPCRLRDFRELLAGTGIGLGSYSIIEQGKVDAALNASPLERRLLFEEAAGISRFRHKKREAAKRLERVEQNMLRLSDIVDEVESRLKRVRSQAGKAQKYRDQSTRLRELRIELAQSDWRSLQGEWEGLDKRHRELNSRLQATRTQAQEQENHIAQPENDSAAAEKLEELDRRLSEARDAITRDESFLDFERRRTPELAQEVASARRATRIARAESLQRKGGPDGGALQAAEIAAKECHSALQLAQQNATRVTEHADRLRSDLNQQRRTLQAIQAEAVELNREEHRLNERLDAMRQSIEELQSEVAKTASNQSGASRELQDAESSRQAAADELAAAEAGLEENTDRLARVRREIEDSQSKLSELHAQEVESRHRLESLAAEEDRLERLNRDIEAMINHAADGEAPRVYGLVADLIQVDVDLAAMVEAALEGRTNHVVVDSGEGVLETLNKQDATFSSRVGFQRLDCQSPAAAVDRIDLTGEPGVMGRADDFVEAEPRFAGLLQRLLGRTWFVDNAATAVRLSRSMGRGLNFVTHAGELIGADGTLLVGPREDRDGVLTRRKRTDELRRSLAAIDAQRTSLGSRVSQLQSELQTSEQRATELTEVAASKRSSLAEAAQREATLRERQTQHAEALGDRRMSLDQRRNSLEELEASLQSVTERHSAADERASAIAQQVQQIERQLAEAEAQRVAERTRWSELRVSAKRHEKLLVSLRESSGQEADGKPDPLQKALKSWKKARSAQRDSELRKLEAGARLAEAVLIHDALLEERRVESEATKLARTIRADASAALTALRTEVEELLTQVAQVELRRQQIDLERGNLCQRLQDDYQVDLRELGAADEGEATECPPLDREEVLSEIDSLRHQVSSMGSVNLESLEEIDELESRYEELSAQYNDLSDAKTALSRLTSRINSDSREMYLTSFETVRGHFREMFQRMFGGGEADLVLVGEEQDDPLEKGVDLIASPPGKELTSLSLLSGGEKTMACVALLLALFRSKPSPFCVLDEVDAALDDANIERFTSVLSEFLSSTQFVVITHSKRTMTGADTLYGVTMQESGVSKQVSVRFEDVSEDGHIRTSALDRGSQGRRAA